MITYRLHYPKKCREDIKNLDKFYKKKLPKSYTGLAGKSFCFSFDTQQGKELFIETIKNAIHNYSETDYDFYANHAVIREN